MDFKVGKIQFAGDRYMDIKSKIENYLSIEENDSEEREFDFNKDVDLMKRMFRVITGMDKDTMSKDQIKEVVDIIKEISEDGEINESIVERRERRKDYRKKRAQLKMESKKYRQSIKFKRLCKFV